MTDTYLRSLGFAPTEPTNTAMTPPFHLAWRYQQENLAQDGTPLFIEHPFGVANCRLSALPAPLDQQDVVATVPLHDRPALEAAIKAFFAKHGGVGQPVPVLVPHMFRPYRRGQ